MIEVILRTNGVLKERLKRFGLISDGDNTHSKSIGEGDGFDAPETRLQRTLRIGIGRSSMTLAILGLYSGPVFAILLSIGACSVTDPGTDALSKWEVRAAQRIESLTPEQVEDYERHLVDNPDDMLARTKLMVHYYRSGRTNPGAGRAHTRHLVWAINRDPNAHMLEQGLHTGISHFENYEGFTEVKDAWESQLKRDPRNTTILDRFSSFVSTHDVERSIELLLSAQEVEPKNAWWAIRLGFEYERLARRSGRESRDPSALKDALAQYDRAYNLHPTGGTLELAVQGRAKSAFLLERYDLAASHAVEMLDVFESSDRESGDLVHEGHTILGRIALLRGDVSQAKTHLLESAKGPSSPVLGSFGPTMTLALELLEENEFEVVSEYLELCSEFWEDERLDQWKAQVKAGQVPSFIFNLR